MSASRRPSPSAVPARPATVSVTPTALDDLARATLEATAALVLVCDVCGRVLLANAAL